MRFFIVILLLVVLSTSIEARIMDASSSVQLPTDAPDRKGKGEAVVEDTTAYDPTVYIPPNLDIDTQH